MNHCILLLFTLYTASQLYWRKGCIFRSWRMSALWSVGLKFLSMSPLHLALISTEHQNRVEWCVALNNSQVLLRFNNSVCVHQNNFSTYKQTGPMVTSVFRTFKEWLSWQGEMCVALICEKVKVQKVSPFKSFMKKWSSNENVTECDNCIGYSSITFMCIFKMLHYRYMLMFIF